MEHKTAIFGNKGMSQDSSISKSSNELVYENKNIRITAREDGTLLSVTNEKFPSEKPEDFEHIYTILGGTFYGSLALPNKVVLFSQFDDLSFIDVCQYNISEGWTKTQLINSESSEAISLNFSAPIEATFYYERDDIQKVYWVDGVNNLRVINIAADALERATWDDSSFDCVPTVDNIPSVTIEKQYGGSGMFPSGVIQYFFSYFKKYGQESKIVKASDLNYISFQDRGAKPDETVNCNFKITLTGLDTSFDYVRVYSAKRTALDGTLDVHIVADVPVSSGSVEVIDTNINQPVIDSSLLYFIGGDAFKASTIEQKDNTLFLGNIETDIPVLTDTEKTILKSYFDNHPITCDYKIVANGDNTEYTYESQIKKSSTEIKGFKYGEYYRVGIQLQDTKGQWTDPLYIDDIEINIAPKIENNYLGELKVWVPSLSCNTGSIEEAIDIDKYKVYRFVMVEPTNNTRKVVAQGVVNPTVFNMQERCAGTNYAVGSWISRPFNSDVHHAHMDTLAPNDNNSSEIQNLQEITRPFNTSSGQGNCSALLLYFKKKYNSTGFDYFICHLVKTRYTDTEINQKYTNKDTLLQGNDLLTDDFILVDSYSSTHKTTSHTRPFYNDIAQWLSKLGYDIASFLSLQDMQSIRAIWGSEGTKNYFTDVTHDFFQLDNYTTPIEDHTNIYYWLSTDVEYTNGEQFFIDSSVVTLNSPEITADSARIQNCAFRLVGLMPINNHYCQHISEFLNFAGLDAYIKSISTERSIPLLSDYLLYDKCIDKVGGVETLQTYYDNHRIYMFQKQESAIGNTELLNGSSSLYSTLKHKIFANYLYSSEIKYLNTVKNYEQSAIDIYKEGVLKLNNKSYSGDYIKLVSSTRPYNVYRENNGASDIDQYSPVYIKTKQTPCAFVELTSEDTNKEILPGCVGTNVTTQSGPDQSTILADWNDIYLNWENITETNDYGRYYLWNNSIHYNMNGEYGSDCFITPNFTLPQTTPFLFVGEIYKKNINSAADLYGPADIETLKKHRWIPITKNLYTLAEESTDPENFEGDTYFQRWECLRTYPATEDDENSVVDIVSFMVETHINLDGRDDINRGPFNLTTKRPTNTNLMNSVYSQMNNIFHYNIVDLNAQGGYVVDKFANQITWSLAKSPVMEVDPWTNINLANVQNAKGEYGPINEITKLGDTLILFQDRAIATIDYNNRTQISTEQGVPIELANSGKVNGISYVSTLYGCKNKHSIISTKTGIYFIDDINKAFINISKEGVKDISTSAGMSLWFAKKLASQSYWDGGQLSTGFVCKYDQKFGDIYIMNNNTCLVYNELLQTFVSLFDEYRYTDMFTFNSGFFYVKPIAEDNADYFVLGKMFSGDYSDDYYITYKINPEPYSDKTFTNIELIADKFTANANIDAESSAKVRDLPFNKLRAWNEYQDTGETIIAEKPYDASNYKDKFRIRHIQLPRASDNNSKYKLDRLRNPWIFLKLKNDAVSGNKLVYHSIITHYYE